MDENGTVTLSESRVRARATPSETLFLLVELDDEIDRLSGKAADNLKDIQFYEAEVVAARKQAETLQHSIKEKKLHVARQEGEIADLTSKRKTHDERLLRIFSPKELAAVQEETAKYQALIQQREEELLALYEEQEKLQHDSEQATAKHERMTKAVARKSAEKRAENAALHLRITALQDRRGDFLAQVDPALRARYERAFERYGGIVAFTIDDMACGGCGWMAVGSELTKLRQNPGRPFDCLNCGRLLVWVGPQGD